MNKLLIQNATIVDPGGPMHRKQHDLLIEDGKVSAMGSIQADAESTVIDATGLYLSFSAVDIGTQSGAPGNEQRETFESLQAAAAVGGYGELAIFSDTDPAIDNSSMVRTILSQEQRQGVQLLPIGAVEQSREKGTMAEFLDMQAAGVVSVSAGRNAIPSTSFILKILEYLKGTKLTLLHRPHQNDMVPRAMVHEGSVSTTLGLKGWPYLSETLLMERDISLVEYISGAISWFDLSSGPALELVKKAKQKQLKVTSSTSIPYLCFAQENNLTFDSNYKFAPPLRTEYDRKLLWESLRDDVLDFVVSGHQPWEEERKKLEFPYAAFGAETLETAFSAFITHCPFDQPEDLWVEKAVQGTRKFLYGSVPHIEENALSDFILFDPHITHEWTQKDIRSKSKNNPFIGKVLKGRVHYRIKGNDYFEP